MPNKVHFWVELNIPPELEEDNSYEILLKINWGDQVGQEVEGTTYRFPFANIFRTWDRKKFKYLDIPTSQHVDNKYIQAKACLRKNNDPSTDLVGISDIGTVSLDEDSTREYQDGLKKSRRKYIEIKIEKSEDKFGYTPPTVNLIPPGKDND